MSENKNRVACNGSMGMFLSTEKSGKVSNNLVGGLDCIVDSEGFSACRYG